MYKDICHSLSLPLLPLYVINESIINQMYIHATAFYEPTATAMVVSPRPLCAGGWWCANSTTSRAASIATTAASVPLATSTTGTTTSTTRTATRTT